MEEDGAAAPNKDVEASAGLEAGAAGAPNPPNGEDAAGGALAAASALAAGAGADDSFWVVLPNPLNMLAGAAGATGFSAAAAGAL